MPPSCLKRVPRGPQEDPKGQHVAAKRLRKAQDGRRVKMDPDEVQAPSDDGFGFNSGSILGSKISYCLVSFETFFRAVSVFMVLNHFWGALGIIILGPSRPKKEPR